MNNQYLHFLFNSCGSTPLHCFGVSGGSIGCSGCTGGSTGCAGCTGGVTVNCANGCAGKK